MPDEMAEAAMEPLLGAPRVGDHYECPAEHLEVLKTLVPNISMLIVIGWRGTEEHFLRLLGEGLPKGVRGLVVCGETDQARQTIMNLQNAGIQGDFWSAPGGFSDAILGHHIEKFLEASTGTGNPLSMR